MENKNTLYKMKNATILLSLGLFLFACGGGDNQSMEDILQSGDLTALRAKRAELVDVQNEYGEKIALLDAQISVLDSSKKIPLITTYVAEKQVFNHYLELQGNVTTKELVVVSPEYSGVLKEVKVKEGQNVADGQVLGIIDDGGLGQQLAQLKIQTELAKTTFERQERLWKDNIGSEIQFLQAKANYEAQEKAVNQLSAQVEKTIIRAPFSGIVDEILTDEGNIVSPGMSQLFRIVNLKNMLVETDVPESHLANVKTSKKVEVILPVLGTSLESKVSSVSNFINPANRTFRIEVPLNNADNQIKPNLTAKLRINDYTNEEALLIPQNVISENAEGEQYVYVITNKKGKEGVAKKVIIETGKTSGDVIEVTKGLNNNSEIIMEGARSVKDGQTVKILTI